MNYVVNMIDTKCAYCYSRMAMMVYRFGSLSVFLPLARWLSTNSINSLSFRVTFFAYMYISACCVRVHVWYAYLYLYSLV